jgi:hypothetical protein
VRARRAKARERLPSYWDPASGNPQVVHEEICSMTSYPRTVSPSAHPRPASGGATDFFLASALYHRQALRPPGEQDARSSNRLLPPIRTACTRTSCVPGSLSPLSQRGRLAETKAPRSLPGDRTFHDVRRPLRRIVHRARSPCSIASRPRAMGVGIFLPRRRCDRASDIPVASFFTSRLPRLRGSCNWPYALRFEGLVRVGGSGDRRDHRSRRPVKVDAS